MEFERDEFSSVDNNTSYQSNSILSTTSSSKSKNKSCFTVIDTNISSDTEIEVITKIWVNLFEKSPRYGTVKLFTIIINCFDVDVCDGAFTNFNSTLMFARIIKCFKTLASIGSLLTPETVKKSSDVQKTLELFTSIFHHHSALFFSDDVHKLYFIFIRNILIKISQTDFIGPRLLATTFGLKIITGLLQSNNLELVQNDLNLLLKEFLIKRWKDSACIVRETVLLELGFWIQIDSQVKILEDFWIYIYWALGDQSTSVQTVALKISKNILNMHCAIPNIVNLLVKKLITVLSKLLLSKNEEVIISAFNLYTTLPSIDEDDDEEQCISNIDSIALELIFSEKLNIAQFVAKHFVDQMVNSQPNVSERLKIILIILRGIPPLLTTIATSFFVDAIYELCPVLTDFKLISQILTLENYIEDNDKYNFMILLMYVVKWLITGVEPEHKTAIMGDQNDITQLHINTFKKKEYTTYMLLHLLNQLKECEDTTHAFSLWVLLQFIDFKLLQDKMILPDILIHATIFYETWNIPTILEMVSKCIHIMKSNLEGCEQNLCLKFIKDVAIVNINILKDGVENASINAPSLMSQKHALIKMWSLAKYNYIPDDLEPLKYLSYYVPNLNNTESNLIISEYALSAYMEVLRQKLLKVSTNFETEFSNEDISESIVENLFLTFLDSMFITLSKFDTQTINICETAFLIVDELLRMKFNIDKQQEKTIYELDTSQNIMLTGFMFSVCRNCEFNDDLNTLKLVDVYLQLIQDGFIDINHLITILQFVKMELFECALRPIFNFFCKKETGVELSRVINVYLVYMFENIISQKSDFKDFTIKDVINVATIITRLLCQCMDQIGKRLVSTNIHRHGIQYAMSDTLNNPYSDYPFKQFFWVLASMCDILIPYDAQHLADYFLNKPTTLELISMGNEHVLRYLYKLQEVSNAEETS